MLRDRALVVQPQQRDRIANVIGTLDPPRRESRLPAEDGVVVDPTLVVQLVPNGFGEAQVQDTVTVEVAEFPAPVLEGEGIRGRLGPL